MQHVGVFLCYLADNQHLLKNIILTEKNTYGLHLVNMIAHAKSHIVAVDDYTLCSEDSTLFTEPIIHLGKPYLWPLIIEKAWLKMKGLSAKILEQSEVESVF